ncbi:MAG: hypothetical protein HOE75_13440 [Chloroflexi bacterium]|nr:hypothetical protein [Chloroflexota bacterium]
MSLDRVGYYVSEDKYYQSFLAETPGFEDANTAIVKSWEVLRAAESTTADPERLKSWEDRLPPGNLWDALVSDRRVVLGDRFDARMDYKPTFAHDEALAYLDQSLLAMEKLFDEVNPDLVVGFVCSTLGEYAAYLVAQDRGVTYLNLRPTRLANYMGLGTTPNEPSEIVRDRFNEYAGGLRDEWWGIAEEYLARTREGDARYEGVVLPSRLTTAQASRTNGKGRSLKRALRLDRVLRDEIKIRKSAPKGDHGVPGRILPFLYKNVFNPRLARRVHKSLRNDYVTLDDMAGKPYAFFPLHMEPEATLLIYSRAYMNQIEVVRNIAYNLPVGMQLVVKEHPVALGKRSPSFYQKLLDVMNVKIADPSTAARPWVEGATMVANISGSVGLEAAILGRPVLTLGNTPYELLPSGMVRKVTELPRLSSEIHSLISEYRKDEDALMCYVAAVMSRSAPVNWYTNLLGRSAYSAETRDFGEDVDILARTVLKAKSDWVNA